MKKEYLIVLNKLNVIQHEGGKNIEMMRRKHIIGTTTIQEKQRGLIQLLEVVKRNLENMVKRDLKKIRVVKIKNQEDHN